MSRKPVFVEARQGEVAPEVLLGLGIGTEDDIANRKSHHELHHEDGPSMITIMTSSRVSWSSLGPVSDAAAFVEGLKTLIVSHDILRLKGFADIPGKPMRMVVQAVGSRIDTHFDRPWAEGKPGRPGWWSSACMTLKKRRSARAWLRWPGRRNASPRRTEGKPERWRRSRRPGTVAG
jgi:G3E family GTPase